MNWLIPSLKEWVHYSKNEFVKKSDFHSSLFLNQHACTVCVSPSYCVMHHTMKWCSKKALPRCSLSISHFPASRTVGQINLQCSQITQSVVPHGNSRKQTKTAHKIKNPLTALRRILKSHLNSARKTAKWINHVYHEEGMGSVSSARKITVQIDWQCLPWAWHVGRVARISLQQNWVNKYSQVPDWHFCYRPTTHSHV